VRTRAKLEGYVFMFLFCQHQSIPFCYVGMLWIGRTRRKEVPSKWKISVSRRGNQPIWNPKYWAKNAVRWNHKRRL